MKISWNWLSELVDLSGVKSAEELANLLTLRGLEVESIDRQDQGLEKVVTAQILERNPHPQADRLSLCQVSLGSGAPLEIVCGAQNMKAGDKVALAQVGARLPNGLTIAQTRIRGVVSNGMLCSLEELKLAESSEGILILPAETKLGRPLAEALGRDDTILSFKLTANRGDCLSHFGMAREVAAALGVRAKRPAAPGLPAGNCPISIHLEAGELASQFHGCLIEGVQVGPSPQWVVRRLEALGSRSISNVVDATNLVMLELGHPMHAYDASNIEGGRIGVRMARAGEELPLLDGKSVTLSGSELVIFDAKRSIGLAGVMGGGNSEVQPDTTRVFLECAEFNPGAIRKAASRHQRRTEAAQRFEKGIDPEGLSTAIARLAQLIVELAGGRVVGSAVARTGGARKLREIRVTPGFFDSFLGISGATQSAERVLNSHDCGIRAQGGEWVVTPPSYRLDLNTPEDLSEEIARSLGYERIAETVPKLTSAPQSIFTSPSESALLLKDRAKDLLVSAGLNEALNFSFTSEAWLSRFGMRSSARLMNPLSEEYESLVPSLLPGLVQNALHNWHHHFGSEPLPIRLFEIRPTFAAAEGELRASDEMTTGMQERWKIAMALSGPRFASGLRNELGELDFYDIKAMVENLLEGLGTRGVRLLPLSRSRAGSSPIQGLFHPGKSVEVLAGKDSAGVFGLIHPALARELKIKAPLWMAEMDWDSLSALSRPIYESKSFHAWSEFPSIERDFALVVRDGATADKITQVASRAGRPLAKVIKVFDIYRGSQVAEGMTSVAVRVIFYEENRSLAESEAEEASGKIVEAWKKELGAELRG